MTKHTLTNNIVIGAFLAFIVALSALGIGGVDYLNGKARIIVLAIVIGTIWVTAISYNKKRKQGLGRKESLGQAIKKAFLDWFK